MFVSSKINEKSVLAHNCLDENLKSLRSFSNNMDSLLNLCMHYGNDFYTRDSSFGKQDRSRMDEVALTDPGFLAYAAMDVQSIFAIHLLQIQESQFQRMGNVESYEATYIRFVLNQMNNNIQMFGHMEQRGSNIDVPYLFKLLGPESPLNTLIADEAKKFYAYPSIKAASKLIGAASNIPEKGLFGRVKTSLFNLATVAHKQILFFKVLKLKPVTYGKALDEEGNQIPGLGKAFQDAYKDTVPEVASLQRVGKLKKLKSSYIEAFWRKLEESSDGKASGRLRPGFGFFDVVSGRSNSFNPSLQQIPTRTAEAKFIKRVFAARKRHLLLKLDFSAHEVRCWSFAAQDFKLGALFKVGRDLRAKLFLATGKVAEALLAEIKLKGDIHIINAHRFFGTPIPDVTKEERDSVKGIVFGAIYGRSIRSIANAAKRTVEFTQKVYNNFFKEYSVAKEWLDWAVETGRKYLHVYSFIGRKRNLYGYLTGVNALMAAMDRRGMNSPIQGVAADIAHTSGWIFMQEVYKTLLHFGYMTDESTDLPFGVETMVHDSSRQEVHYKYLLIALQIFQYCYTTGAEKYYELVFGVKFTAHLEIEIEIGADESRLHKWNFNLASLKDVFRKALTDQKSDIDPDLDIDKALAQIWKPWSNEQIVNYMNTHYPFFAD